MENLSRGIILAVSVAFTTVMLSYLVKSARFKKFLRKSDAEEIEAIERINREEIPQADKNRHTLKTSIGKLLAIEISSLGVGIFMPFIGLMAYLENGQPGFLYVFTIMGVILFLYGIRILLLEAIKIHASSDIVTIERLFFRPYIIKHADIDKVILYWGTTNGIIRKKYFAVNILYKNKKKFHFLTNAMREKNTERLVGYFHSNFSTEECKRIYL